MKYSKQKKKKRLKLINERIGKQKRKSVEPKVSCFENISNVDKALAILIKKKEHTNY